MKRSLILAVILFASAAHAQEKPFGLKPENLAGDWTISSPAMSGDCQLTLEVSKSPYGYPAYVYGCTAEDLQRVTGWRLRSTSILLTDDKSAPVILLKIKNRDRFEGRMPSGSDIVLSR